MYCCQPRPKIFIQVVPRAPPPPPSVVQNESLSIASTAVGSADGSPPTIFPPPFGFVTIFDKTLSHTGPLNFLGFTGIGISLSQAKTVRIGFSAMVVGGTDITCTLVFISAVETPIATLALVDGELSSAAETVVAIPSSGVFRVNFASSAGTQTVQSATATVSASVDGQ